MKHLLTSTALVLSLSIASLAYAADAPAPAAPAKAAAAKAEAPKPNRGLPPFMEAAVAKLPADKAAAFRDTMEKGHEKNKEARPDMRKLNDERRDMLTAAKFDKKAYLAKSKEIIDAENKMRMSRDEVFADAISALSQSERQAFAEGLKESRGKRGPDAPPPAPAK